MPSKHQQLLTREDLSGSCLEPGTELDGRYVIERVLGEGTFAWVYLAHHSTIESLQCAIKVLKPHFVGDDELRQQFRHEAETVARLRDRHTVRVSDMGELPDGRPYICMEYCVGSTLDRLIASQGPLPEMAVAHIARGVLHSLREAHSLGIVHRDIKPSNVSLTDDPGSPVPLTRVLDFGIAYAAQVSNSGKEAVDSDLVFCTPSYAAPEVLRGQVSSSADLYALGLTLAELLDGEPVFPNTGFYTVAARQMANEPVPFGPKARQSTLAPLLERACEKEISKRFSSADEMLEMLDELWEELPPTQHFSWEHIAPPSCVGVHRCGLAADRLDMSKPAGCALHPYCAAANHAAPELRVRDDMHAPAPLDIRNFESLQEALEESDSSERFMVGEFSDTFTAPNAPTDPIRPYVSRDAENPVPTEDNQPYRTVRTHRMAANPLLAAYQPQEVPSRRERLAATEKADEATFPLTARYRNRVGEIMRDILPQHHPMQRHALLIANSSLLLAIFTMLMVVLFRGTLF